MRNRCPFRQRTPLTVSRYRTITPKARLIPLTQPFLEYLRADGIVLPSSAPPSPILDTDADSGVFTSDTEEESDDESPDPSLAWPEIHSSIKDTIAVLGDSVVPKLNWSAPKDATWISATNSMECTTPNDVYLLLKSSDFITHDLEQAFDGCESDSATDADGTVATQLTPEPSIPYHLILRKTIPAIIPSLEFRCFVRRRRLLCICQRDLNHYEFLPSLIPLLKSLITGFFEQKLQETFPDENFVFDVYVPQPRETGRVWLVDVNPWAIRTDPLLFSWMEILGMPEPEPEIGNQREESAGEGFVRVYVDSEGRATGTEVFRGQDQQIEDDDIDESDQDEESSDDDDVEDLDVGPEFRMVKRDDPEAYSFNTPQYSAHKLPKDVVDAGADGQAGLAEFMGRWRDIVSAQEREEEDM